MKIGFVSSILEQDTLEQTIDFASEQGFECVEVACWPSGKAERRYAGVSHIDVEQLDEEQAEAVKEYCRQKKIQISALAYYPNTMDPDLNKRAAVIAHLKQVIRAASKLDVNLVTTFIGRDPTKTVEENLELVKMVWPPILEEAESLGVNIAIENCPMLFGKEQWPGGQNLMTTPAVWKQVFEILPSKNLGINYDPSHFVWQMIDYIKPLYEFRDKIFHVHFKDIKVYKDQLDQYGIMGYPLSFMAPKLPGLGDVDWSRFCSALTDIGYKGFACIEVEDRAFEADQEEIKKSLKLSKRYMEQFVI